MCFTVTAIGFLLLLVLYCLFMKGSTDERDRLLGDEKQMEILSKSEKDGESKMEEKVKTGEDSGA